MITWAIGNHKLTYPVRAAEHVKYEYFILDMMIYGDTLAIYNIIDFIILIIKSAMRFHFLVMILKWLGSLLWHLSSICVFIELIMLKIS